MARYRLIREGKGRYTTADEIFTVWYAHDDYMTGSEGTWYVNHRKFDETLYLGGFRYKADAVKWLKQQYADKPDYLFGESVLSLEDA